MGEMGGNWSKWEKNGETKLGKMGCGGAVEVEECCGGVGGRAWRCWVAPVCVEVW